MTLTFGTAEFQLTVATIGWVGLHPSTVAGVTVSDARTTLSVLDGVPECTEAPELDTADACCWAWPQAPSDAATATITTPKTIDLTNIFSTSS